jgi:7,8-dihydro-6-hydroxymethylpterin-pyrophosphokinase
MRNEMNNLPKLIEAKIDAWSSVFSDDASCVKRDNDYYNSLIASQSEYTDEEVSAFASQLWNGEKTRAELRMSA